MTAILKYGIFQIYIFYCDIVIEFFYFIFPEVRIAYFGEKL